MVDGAMAAHHFVDVIATCDFNALILSEMCVFVH